MWSVRCWVCGATAEGVCRFCGRGICKTHARTQAFLFAAFSLFWTVTPLLLAGPEFGLSQRGIALFALAGVAGAIAALLFGFFVVFWFVLPRAIRR